MQPFVDCFGAGLEYFAFPTLIDGKARQSFTYFLVDMADKVADVPVTPSMREALTTITPEQLLVPLDRDLARSVVCDRRCYQARLLLSFENDKDHYKRMPRMSMDKALEIHRNLISKYVPHRFQLKLSEPSPDQVSRPYQIYKSKCYSKEAGGGLRCTKIP